MATKWRL